MSRAFGEFSRFAATAAGTAPAQVKSINPETAGPVQQISKLFKFQSYFDSTLLQTAILEQSRNEPIVASTAVESQIPGYAIGLHPSSETPVAVQFKVGAQSASSQAIVLTPGQVVRPHGLPRDMKSGVFSGFRWGLPFGWLGGGVATLVVFQTPDSDVSWAGDPEVIYHRQRMQIVNAAGFPTNAPKNWPNRFPWTQARFGASSISQQGQAQIAVTPTRVMMRLRSASLAAPAVMRIVLHETTAFDLDSAGAVVAGVAGFLEQTWGSYAVAGGAGNLSTQYPYINIADAALLGADDGGVTLQDMTGTLVNLYVDVVRYGRL